MMLTQLTYTTDTADLFAAIATLPYAVFLDSGFPYSRQGRFDIMTALPYIVLTTTGLTTTIQSENTLLTSSADPFSLVKDYLSQAAFAMPDDLPAMPFIGGAIGYFAYDLGRRIEKLPVLAQCDIDLPDMIIGIYDWAIVVDHQQRCAWLIQQNNSTETAGICTDIINLLYTAKLKTDYIAPVLLSTFQANFTKATYAKAFTRIQDYLKSGDCYQVNLAQRFSASITGDPWPLYQTLRQHNPAPYSAFLNVPDAAVLSLSPERFLKVHDHKVETKPIKGTRPRDLNDKAHDQALAQALLDSEKDRAENLMIVDLLRNDLSKSCLPGTVKVPHLFALESFTAVHHLVSTVTGQLAPDKQAIDLLRGCFPGGSITGAPKLRAMQIIEELEPHRRNLYCGAIGYLDFKGNMDTNIAIRTLIWRGQQIHCHAGGAITIESELEAEYAEITAKIAVILKTLNKFNQR